MLSEANGLRTIAYMHCHDVIVDFRCIYMSFDDSMV